MTGRQSPGQSNGVGASGLLRPTKVLAGGGGPWPENQVGGSSGVIEGTLNHEGGDQRAGIRQSIKPASSRRCDVTGLV